MAIRQPVAGNKASVALTKPPLFSLNIGLELNAWVRKVMMQKECSNDNEAFSEHVLYLIETDCLGAATRLSIG